MRFEPVDVVPFEPVTLDPKKSHLLVCCTCGLVHGFRVEVLKTGEVDITMWRDVKETRKERKKERRKQGK